MSLLPNAVYANPTTTCWEPETAGAGNNPTFVTVTLANNNNTGYLTASNVGPAGSALAVGNQGGGAPLATGRLYVYDTGNTISGNNGRMEVIGSDTGMSISWLQPVTSTTFPFMGMNNGNVAMSNITTVNGATYFTPAYGSFSSTQTQAFAAATPTALVYDTADVTPVGMSCAFPSGDITVTAAGTYKVLASLQCDNTAPGSSVLDMYVAINTVAVPNSATRVAINQNQETVMTVEWLLTLTAGQNVSVYCYAANPGLQALAVPAAPPVPAIPSIITTLVRIA